MASGTGIEREFPQIFLSPISNTVNAVPSSQLPLSSGIARVVKARIAYGRSPYAATEPLPLPAAFALLLLTILFNSKQLAQTATLYHADQESEIVGISREPNPMLRKQVCHPKCSFRPSIMQPQEDGGSFWNMRILITSVNTASNNTATTAEKGIHNFPNSIAPRRVSTTVIVIATYQLTELLVSLRIRLTVRRNSPRDLSLNKPPDKKIIPITIRMDSCIM